MKLTIIANPTSGRGRALPRLKKYLSRWPHASWEYELIETCGPEHAGQLASELCAHPPDMLAIAGGDGTMKEVASRVPDPPFPVGIIPAGTSNLLAREIGMPRDIAGAIAVILRSRVRKVDLGILKGRSEHRFLLMAGIGFDAYVVAGLRPATKRRLGAAAYFARAVMSHLTYRFEEFQVIIDGAALPATSCIVANARRYGGGLHFTPQADLSSGELEILIVRRASIPVYVRLVLCAWLGRPLQSRFIRRARARNVRVEGPRGIWVQLDGEPVGSLPVDISVAASAFPLIVPDEPARDTV